MRRIVHRAHPSVCTVLIPLCAPCSSLCVHRAHPSVCTVLIPLCAPCLSLCVHRAHPSVCAVLIHLCVPCLSLCVCRTLTLSLKVCRLEKCRNPWIAALFQGSRYFSKDRGTFPRIAVLFQGSRYFSKDRGTFPRIAVLFQGSRHFSKVCGTFPVKMWRVSPNRGALAKIVTHLAKSSTIRFPHKSRGKP